MTDYERLADALRSSALSDGIRRARARANEIAGAE